MRTIDSRKERRIQTALVVFALAVLVPGSTGITAIAAPADEGCDKQCRADLDEARAATEQYWDVTAALRDGFVEMPSIASPDKSLSCGSSAQGVIGIHYTHLGRAADQSVNVAEPESLMYVPDTLVGWRVHGRRLVAVEYSVPVLAAGQARPELFGRPFNGPEASGGTELERYYLRVWLFSENPEGPFADANPTEACDGEGPLEWHNKSKNCVEVTGTLSVREDLLREVDDIPDRFAPLPGTTPGTVQVNVGTRRCDTTEFPDGSTDEPLLNAQYAALVEPHDYFSPPGLSAVAPLSLNTQYLFRFFASSRDVAKAARQGMRVTRDVVAYSPELERHFNPFDGSTGTDYRFSTPDFVLDAPVLAPRRADSPGTVRLLRETSRGLAKLHVWLELTGSGATEVRVTPIPGSPLARMVGCASTASSCDPIRADYGLVVIFNTSVRATDQ